MKTKMFALGDDVYVRDPERFIEGATCIVGTISAVLEDSATGEQLFGLVNEGHPATGEVMMFRASELGIRGGIPINQLSGRPGEPGWEKWCKIARSWGYP